MEINNKQILNRMDFSDFQVLNSNIDKKEKTICFLLTGALILKKNRSVVELGEGYLKIERYDNISISSYNANEHTKKTLSEDNYENLREICEIELSENNLIIKGFAINTFNWIEFHVEGGVLSGEFADKNEGGERTNSFFV